LTAAYNLIEQRLGGAFTYDWRADIEYSAERLLEQLRKTKPANGRFSLVCHSQGGLVALVASKLCEKAEGRESFSALVSRIVFVGVPVYGTLNAAHALLVGTDLGEQPQEEFRRIAATWPAIYQMLPAFFALRSPDGMTTRRSFLGTRTYDPYPWVDKDLVRRAFYFRKEFLSQPVSALQGIEYRFLFGSNKPTWEYATRAANGAITFGEKLAACGDGLVPWRVFERIADDVMVQRSEVVGPNENVAEHAMLLTDDFCVTRLLEVLK
jgi:pimeloyl-ACP methyl ester carboxylesterase